MSGTAIGSRAADTRRLGERPARRRGGRHRAIRKRHGLKIALISLASLFTLVVAAAVGSILVLNHLASSIRRIPVSFANLTAAQAPAGSLVSRGMTVLITGAGIGPAGSSVAGPGGSGLIMLLHIDANHQASGVVSIPPQSLVTVPGHGRMPIQFALAAGGPSLLVRTVEQSTHVPVSHYVRIDFAHVANLVNAVGGVDVVLPAPATSFGHRFPAGTDHLDGTAALAYVRQPSLTQEGRVLRQQSLIRAVLGKVAGSHLLINPVTAYHVLSALTAMLTVDSNVTNTGLASLAARLGELNSNFETFVTAPVQTSGAQVFLNTRVSGQLWQAIRHDSIAAFAKRYPATVTPQEVP